MMCVHAAPRHALVGPRWWSRRRVFRVHSRVVRNHHGAGRVQCAETAVAVSAVGAVCLARGYAVPHNRKPHSVAASCLSVSRLPSVHCWRYTYRVLLVLPSAPAGATYTGGGGPARPARVVLAVRRVVSGPPGLPNNILYSHTDLYYTLTPLTARLGRGVVRAGAAAKSLYLATFQRDQPPHIR